MAHPFEKLMYRALRDSTEEENKVTEVLRELLNKQYPEAEVCNVALKLKQSLVDENEESLVAEAIEDICYGFEEDS